MLWWLTSREKLCKQDKCKHGTNRCNGQTPFAGSLPVISLLMCFYLALEISLQGSGKGSDLPTFSGLFKDSSPRTTAQKEQ